MYASIGIISNFTIFLKKYLMYFVLAITNFILFKSQITCIKNNFNVISSIIQIVNPKLPVNNFNSLNNY